MSISPALGGFVEYIRQQFLTDTFVADGAGGRQLEVAVRGRYAAVLDAALDELIAESAGPDRLTGAGLAGVPQIVVPGGLDRVTDLKLIDRLGKQVALKTSAAKGPVTLLIPKRSWSAGQSVSPELAAVFTASVNHWRAPHVKLIEMDAAIDEEAFAAQVIAELWQLTATSPAPVCS